MGFFSFPNFHYFDLLPLEFILFATLLISFHHFFLTSHHFSPWKRFVISKHIQTHARFSAAQSNGRLFLDYLPWMVSAKKKQMSETQLLKAKQSKLKENEKMLRQIQSFFKQTHIPYLGLKKNCLSSNRNIRECLWSARWLECNKCNFASL